MKIVMLEPIAVAEDLLNELSQPIRDKSHTVEFCTKPMTGEEKLAKAKDADALIIANSPLQAELLEAASGVKFISVAFTGIDHVPAQICKQKGITVSNAQGYATVAVTELTYGLVFSCLRNMLPCDKAARSGLTKDGLVGNELYGKTFGIIGYGAIGQSVAKAAEVFGCKVLAFARRPQENNGSVTFCSLETLLKESDIVSLHVPLTDETRCLINASSLSNMKPTAILINTARGGVVDSKALAGALNNGAIAAAGIDVFDAEPPLPSNDPLITAKNTVLAPHIGFATKESMVKRAKIVFDNVSAWLDGNPVNVKI